MSLEIIGWKLEDSCMLFVHKHRDTSSEMMHVDAHDMIIMVFMDSMTPDVPID